MKTVIRELGTILILLLVLCGIAQAQSDCGNCWIVGGGCDASTCDGSCGIGCAFCIYYVDCDYHDCAYNTGWFCNCRGSGWPPPTECNTAQLKPDTLIRRAQALLTPNHALKFSLLVKAPVVIQPATVVLKHIDIKTRFWWKEKRAA